MKYVKGGLYLGAFILVAWFLLTAFGYIGGPARGNGESAGNVLTRGLDFLAGIASAVRAWANRN